MKYTTLVLLCLTLQQALGQEPFERNELLLRAVYNDTIMPRYVDGAFYYINPKTGKKRFETGFETAYPFNHKGAVVKIDGKYGLIDAYGNYVVMPKYDGYSYETGKMYGNPNVYFYTYFQEIRAVNADLKTLVITPENEDEPYLVENRYWRRNYNHGNIEAVQLQNDTLFSHFGIKVSPRKKQLTVTFDSFPNVVLTGDELAYYYVDRERCVGDPWPMLAVAVRNRNTWEYYVLQHDYKLKRIAKNKYRPALPGISITHKGEMFVMKDNKFNIIYDDGSMLKTDYDYISGNMAVKGKAIYIIDKGVEFLYYKPE